MTGVIAAPPAQSLPTLLGSMRRRMDTGCAAETKKELPIASTSLPSLPSLFSSIQKHDSESSLGCQKTTLEEKPRLKRQSNKICKQVEQARRTISILADLEEPRIGARPSMAPHSKTIRPFQLLAAELDATSAPRASFWTSAPGAQVPSPSVLAPLAVHCTLPPTLPFSPIGFISPVTLHAAAPIKLPEALQQGSQNLSSKPGVESGGLCGAQPEAKTEKRKNGRRGHRGSKALSKQISKETAADRLSVDEAAAVAASALATAMSSGIFPRAA